MKLCQLASGQCFSVRPYAETGFKKETVENIEQWKSDSQAARKKGFF